MNGEKFPGSQSVMSYGGVLVYAFASSPAWRRRSSFNDRDLLLSDGGVSNRYLETYMCTKC